MTPLRKILEELLFVYQDIDFAHQQILALIPNITPEQLHEWYLEATKHLDPQYVNPKAQIPYDELKPSQKAIDKYIANKIRNDMV